MPDPSEPKPFPEMLKEMGERWAQTIRAVPGAVASLPGETARWFDETFGSQAPGLSILADLGDVAKQFDYGPISPVGAGQGAGLKYLPIGSKAREILTDLERLRAAPSLESAIIKPQTKLAEQGVPKLQEYFHPAAWNVVNTAAPRKRTKGGIGVARPTEETVDDLLYKEDPSMRRMLVSGFYRSEGVPFEMPWKKELPAGLAFGYGPGADYKPLMLVATKDLTDPRDIRRHEFTHFLNYNLRPSTHEVLMKSFQRRTPELLDYAEQNPEAYLTQNLGKFLAPESEFEKRMAFDEILAEQLAGQGIKLGPERHLLSRKGQAEQRVMDFFLERK